MKFNPAASYRKIILSLFFCGIVFASSSIFSQKVSAQVCTSPSYCGSQIQLDGYLCKSIYNLDGDTVACDWVTSGSKVTYACNGNNSSCYTTSAACTSNDSSAACQFKSVDGNTWCQTNYSACSTATCCINPADPA